MRDAYKLQSRRIPYRLDAEGEPGTRTNPITDPQDLMGIDLMHTRIGGTATPTAPSAATPPLPPPTATTPCGASTAAPPPPP